MKLRMASLAFLIMLSGCVSARTTIPADVADQIPLDANVIRLYSDTAPSDFYRSLYRETVARGYEIAESNNEMLTFSTAYRNTVQETTVALSIFVADRDGGSMAIMRGRWGVSASVAGALGATFGTSVEKEVGEMAKWKPRERSGIAFGQIAVLADQIAHNLDARLEYAQE